MQPRDPYLRQQLSAFADGELDPAAARQLQRAIASDPAAQDHLHQLQQLSTAARHAVRTRTPAPSDALRSRLKEIAPAAIPAPPLQHSPAFPSWWTPLIRAAAALVLLAVGAWAGYQIAKSSAPTSYVQRPSASAQVIPADIISQAEEIHGVCARLALGLHSGAYPTQVAALATAVEHDLHSDHPWPNLAPIGFHYRGAGPCGKPMADTAHLLYNSVRPGSANAISVLVQPWRGQYPLEPNRVYTVSVPQDGFPMLAWRTQDVVYFLLADNMTTEQQALALIRGAPTTQP